MCLMNVLQPVRLTAPGLRCDEPVLPDPLPASVGSPSGWRGYKPLDGSGLLGREPEAPSDARFEELGPRHFWQSIDVAAGDRYIYYRSGSILSRTEAASLPFHLPVGALPSRAFVAGLRGHSSIFR